MQYKTLTIKPNITGDKWEISIVKDYKDRVAYDTVPNPMGYYHYDAELHDDVAIHSLLNCMIASHISKIVQLKESLKGLQALRG